MLPPEFLGLDKEKYGAFNRRGFAPRAKASSSIPNSSSGKDNLVKSFAGYASKTSFAALLDALEKGEDEFFQALHQSDGAHEEEYSKVKAQLEEAKLKEKDLKNAINLPMEDEPGSFATMLEMTLDFFFLTPVLFSKADGTPVFEPRENDKPLLELALHPRAPDGSVPDKNNLNPTLMFLPPSTPGVSDDQPVETRPKKHPSSAVYPGSEFIEVIEDGEQTVMSTTIEQPTSSNGTNAEISLPAQGVFGEIVEKTSQNYSLQPRPSESRSLELVNLYKPDIPYGHKFIPKNEYSYDEAFSLCPVMASGKVNKPGFRCQIHLPAIFIPLQVYGLPKICASNLIYCIHKLYRMFNVRLPAGIEWSSLVLRLEGSRTPFDPLDDLFPEGEDQDSEESHIMSVDYVPTLYLESKTENITVWVTNSPKPLTIQLIEDENATLNSTMRKKNTHSKTRNLTNRHDRRSNKHRSAETESDSASDPENEGEGEGEGASVAAPKRSPHPLAVSSLRERVLLANKKLKDMKEKPSTKKTQTGAFGGENLSSSTANATIASDIDEDDDDDNDEQTRLLNSLRSQSSPSMKSSATADAESSEDSELDQYYERLTLRRKRLPTNWQQQISNYEPTRAARKVILEDFPKSFTVADLKLAAATVANLELTQEECLHLALWREVQLPMEPILKDSNTDKSDSASSGYPSFQSSTARDNLTAEQSTMNMEKPVFARGTPVADIALPHVCQYKWEPVEIPNHYRLWDLLLDARGKAHNVFELQFDIKSLSLALATKKAERVKESRPQSLNDIDADEVDVEEDNYANSLRKHDDEKSFYDSIRQEQGISPLESTDLNKKSTVINSLHKSTEDASSTTSNATTSNTSNGTAAGKSNPINTSSSIQERLGSLDPMLDIRTNTKIIQNNIIKRQTRKIREVSYQRIRDSGLLDDHLRALSNVKSTSVTDGNGWLTTKMLVFYMIVYILGIGVYFSLGKLFEEDRLANKMNDALANKEFLRAKFDQFSSNNPKSLGEVDLDLDILKNLAQHQKSNDNTFDEDVVDIDENRPASSKDHLETILNQLKNKNL